MKEFDEKEVCEACGFDKIDVKFVERGLPADFNPPAYPRPNMSIFEKREWAMEVVKKAQLPPILQCTCMRCKKAWDRATVS